MGTADPFPVNDVRKIFAATACIADQSLLTTKKGLVNKLLIGSLHFPIFKFVWFLSVGYT